MASEIDALQAASNRIADQIRAAQQARAGQATSTPSSSGLIWPVNGPVTSPFGWRWGRMHQGIDIGVPTGTPIHAAASGTVIYCGWEEGYGNLVVLDNGGNLATAYAHQSSIAVTCGQSTSTATQRRIDGNPDPLGYLHGGTSALPVGPLHRPTSICEVADRTPASTPSDPASKSGPAADDQATMAAAAVVA